MLLYDCGTERLLSQLVCLMPRCHAISAKASTPTLMIDFGTYKMKPDDDVLVVGVCGDLDTESAEYFFSCLANEIENGHIKVIVDCRGLEHMSSMGLAMLIRAHSRLKKHGGDVKIARIEGVVATVIRKVNLDKLLNIYPTVRAAHAAFAK